MFCEECRSVVSDKFLACPNCALERAMRALWRYQFDPLRMVFDGHQDALATRAQRGVRHVKMFGAERTFCGRDVHTGDRRGRIDPNLESMNVICGACREAVERALDEARQLTKGD